MNLHKRVTYMGYLVFTATMALALMLSIGVPMANAYTFADGFVLKNQSCIYARNPRAVNFVIHKATGSDSGGHLVTRTAPKAESSTNGESCSTVSGLYGIKSGQGTFTYFSGEVRVYTD